MSMRASSQSVDPRLLPRPPEPRCAIGDDGGMPSSATRPRTRRTSSGWKARPGRPQRTLFPPRGVSPRHDIGRGHGRDQAGRALRALRIRLRALRIRLRGASPPSRRNARPAPAPASRQSEGVQHRDLVVLQLVARDL
jgi:hypothetical protein